MWALLTTCLHCGSFFARRNLLCDACFSNINYSAFCGIRGEKVEDLSIYSLFEWAPGQSDLLSKLFLVLKGQQQEKAWSHWAQAFWKQRQAMGRLNKPLVFYSAPGSSGTKDHAFFFAQSLAQASCGTFYGSLQKDSPIQQKRAGREDRKRVKVSSPVNIPWQSAGVQVVLVDDIITTGATARACYEALGRPKNFEVWSLGRRGLACEGIGDLLYSGDEFKA